MPPCIEPEKSAPAPRPSLRQRLFARMTAAAESSSNHKLAQHKRRIFQDISGTVLEIGPGAGANLPYFPAGIHWIAIEPNPAMHVYLRQKAKQYNITADFRLNAAERLDVPDNSVDIVVSTLVLCSVTDQETTLREIYRVLKPGGRFLFIEHIAAPADTWLRRVQNLVQPVWTFVGDGCHPNRETWAALENAGFESLDYANGRLEVPIVSPIITGVAIKGRAKEVPEFK